MAKRSFYRAANAILGKIGGRATEDVILQLNKNLFAVNVCQHYCMANWKHILCAKPIVTHSICCCQPSVYKTIYDKQY